MKRVKALDRVKGELVAAKLQTQAVHRQLEAAEHNATQLRREVEMKNAQIVSKNEALLHRDRELEIAREKLKIKEEELKRTDRLIDQFLSVQIVGHGQQLAQNSIHLSAPSSLRRT